MATRPERAPRVCDHSMARAVSVSSSGDVGPVDFDPVTNSQEPDIKSFQAIAEKQELKPSRRRELERLLAESRKHADQFVKDMERTVSEITAREEPGKG